MLRGSTWLDHEVLRRCAVGSVYSCGQSLVTMARTKNKKEAVDWGGRRWFLEN
jgi:hypothetical protein